jgi:hypothetical protein
MTGLFDRRRGKPSPQRSGGEVGVRLNRSVGLLGEGGVATARTLTYADGKTRLSSLNVGAQPYVSISLWYSFSKKEHWENFGEGSGKK